MISGDELKKKWKNLRDSYAKYLKSIKTKTGQSAKKKYKNWQWATIMEAFKPFLTFAQTESNVTDIDIEGQIADSLEKTDTVVQNDTEQKDNENETVENYNDGKTPQTDSPIAAPVLKPKPKRKITDKCSESSVNTVIEYLMNKKQKKEMTPTDMIFLGYSQTIQTFSPRRQALTKLKIAEIMGEQECLHLESLSYSRPSSAALPSPLESNSLSYYEHDNVSRPSTSNSNYISTNLRDSSEDTSDYLIFHNI